MAASVLLAGVFALGYLGHWSGFRWRWLLLGLVVLAYFWARSRWKRGSRFPVASSHVSKARPKFPAARED